MLALNDAFVFPVNELNEVSGNIVAQHLGMTQRALFAAILMHGELTTCGVPGEACEALVKASVDSGREVEDQMANNAVQCADALLRALAEPAPSPPAPPHRPSVEEQFFPRFEATLRDVAAGRMPLIQTVQNLLAEYDDGQIPF